MQTRRAAEPLESGRRLTADKARNDRETNTERPRHGRGTSVDLPRIWPWVRRGDDAELPRRADGATATPVPTITPPPTATPEGYVEGWELVWQDEFDGLEIDLDKWAHEVNGRGGGNQELHYYTDFPENSYIENGNLVIEDNSGAVTNNTLTLQSNPSANVLVVSDPKYPALQV